MAKRHLSKHRVKKLHIHLTTYSQLQVHRAAVVVHFIRTKHVRGIEKRIICLNTNTSNVTKWTGAAQFCNKDKVHYGKDA